MPGLNGIKLMSIIENQGNIKVHFAGLENNDFARILNKVSGLQYGLLTVFPFICNQFGIKPLTFNYTIPTGHQWMHENFRHTIMDSGLFTLMFGANAIKDPSKKLMTDYFEAIKTFAIETELECTLVEVDCQKFLGPEFAWKLRRRFRDELTMRQINVFHIEDGQKGLDRLIEFSDYLAISVPELRRANKKDYVYRLANYIKNKRPDLDIHLLGCTDKKMLGSLKFCTSSDSTSWQKINRWGSLSFNYRKERHITIKNRHINKDRLIDDLGHGIEQVLATMGLEPTPIRMEYYSKYAFAAKMMKGHYEKYAGDQS